MEATPTPAHPQPGRWLVDPSKSTIGFRTKNFIGMRVEGRFTDFDGTVEVGEEPRDSSIRVSIPVRGIDTRSKMRDRDLLKKSVFYADQWPEIRFESAGIRPGDDGRFAITGTLRVRDQSKTVEVAAAEADSGPGEHHYTATSRLNPRDYGITHPFVRRDVDISIDVWLTRADG